MLEKITVNEPSFEQLCELEHDLDVDMAEVREAMLESYDSYQTSNLMHL